MTFKHQAIFLKTTAILAMAPILFSFGCQKEQTANLAQSAPSSNDSDQRSSPTVAEIQPLRTTSSTDNGFVLQLIGKSKCGQSSRDLYDWKQKKKREGLKEITDACDTANKKARDSYTGSQAWKKDLICEGMCPKKVTVQIQQTKAGLKVNGGVNGTLSTSQNSTNNDTNTATSNTTKTDNGNSNQTANANTTTTTNNTKTCSFDGDTKELKCVPGATDTSNASATDNKVSTTDTKNEATTGDTRNTTKTTGNNETLSMTANLTFSFALTADKSQTAVVECLSVDTTQSFYSALLDQLTVCE